MSHGHGDHWEAIDGDAKRTISELLPVATRDSKADGKSEFDFTGEDGVTRREKAFGLIYGDAPLGFFVLVTSDSGAREPRNLVFSAYPVCRNGIEHRLTVERILPWEAGLEAVVEATIEGKSATVWFFDPFYYRNKDIYQVGQTYTFSLAALAMRLAQPTQNEIEITEGPMIQLERERALKDDPSADVSKITNVKVSLAGCSMCIPSKDYPDEASYRGVASEVGYFELEGRGFYRIKTTLMKPDDAPFDTLLYASKSILNGYRPQIGDNLEGIIWMQGWIVD